MEAQGSGPARSWATLAAAALWWAAGAVAVGACGRAREAPPPGEVDLTRGFTPSRTAGGSRPWGEAGAFLVGSAKGGSTVRMRQRLAAGDWEALGGGLWRARRLVPWAEQGAGADEEPRLELDGRAIAALPEGPWSHALSQSRPGEVSPALLEALQGAVDGPAFRLHGPFVFVFDPAGEAPGPGVLDEALSLGEPVEDGWTMRIADLTARAVPVLAGHAEQRTVDLPPDSRLVFTAAAVGAEARAGEPPREARMRVALDGAPLFERRVEISAELDPVACSVPLPPAGGRGRRITFEVEGPPCLGAFLVPRLAPAAPPPRGERERPDLVLFLADTFRADNLAAFGGDPRVTPALDRLAGESVVFARARANSSWTLPSHATMFSGLFPYQCGATNGDSRLPGAARTVAEVLRAGGYRTVAITEGGFVSPSFGLAQGFEWFQVGPRDLARTIARTLERIDADDGRPLFLFVHTYRAHEPYEASPESLERLGLALSEEERAALAKLPAREGGTPVPEDLRAALFALYRAGAADLDAGFAELRRAAEARGLWRQAFWLFTSDHGEAFFEHGVRGHGNGVWEEHLRVPLLIRGPGIRPRREERPASLVDLPRTLAALAGLAPDPRWLGTDLLRLEVDRPTFAFQCTRRSSGESGPRPPDRGALLVGSRKIVFVHEDPEGEPPRAALAYDLARDPHERENRREAPWVRALLTSHERTLRALLRPLFTAGRARPDERTENALRALGYLGR